MLRLLHIAELRELQTKVNELIASVQALVADPKTNVKLGKVGKKIVGSPAHDLEDGSNSRLNVIGNTEFQHLTLVLVENLQ